VGRPPAGPGAAESRAGDRRPVRIGRNMWTGGGAINPPGVTIGGETLVGAGSVVRDGATAFGSPALPKP
jgi:maltose O-acetyltransferase